MSHIYYVFLLQMIVDRLVCLSSEYGSEDNVTVVLVVLKRSRFAPVFARGDPLTALPNAAVVELATAQSAITDPLTALVVEVVTAHSAVTDDSSNITQLVNSVNRDLAFNLYVTPLAHLTYLDLE